MLLGRQQTHRSTPDERPPPPIRQDILSIPAAKRQEFNEKMIHFYESAEATEMMAFLSRCQIRSKFE